ncbi:hypothetical protein GCM10028787_10710 [Brachybacterium horti]
MTRRPVPAGDPITAYRRVLARARRAEADNKDLRARLHDKGVPDDPPRKDAAG